MERRRSSLANNFWSKYNRSHNRQLPGVMHHLRRRQPVVSGLRKEPLRRQGVVQACEARLPLERRKTAVPLEKCCGTTGCLRQNPHEKQQGHQSTSLLDRPKSGLRGGCSQAWEYCFVRLKWKPRMEEAHFSDRIPGRTVGVDDLSILAPSARCQIVRSVFAMYACSTNGLSSSRVAKARILSEKPI